MNLKLKILKYTTAAAILGFSVASFALQCPTAQYIRDNATQDNQTYGLILTPGPPLGKFLSRAPNQYHYPNKPYVDNLRSVEINTGGGTTLCIYTNASTPSLKGSIIFTLLNNTPIFKGTVPTKWKLAGSMCESSFASGCTFQRVDK